MSRKEARERKKRKKRYRLKPRFFIAVLLLVAFIGGGAWLFMEEQGKQLYPTVMNDGRKIMLAAREYINSPLTYEPSSYAGGYPPEGYGVCADVIWKGFNGIDVCIKNMVDADIAENTDAYLDVMPSVDPDLNFRWVPVLERFFERHAQKLTTNLNNEIAWQPGDIVVFESSHIAIVSDIHNIKGRPFIIQHGHDPAAEEDRIEAEDGMKISSHFRWHGALEVDEW